jgi:ATP-dependent exoDNAse (exonuclease V) beta subunit
VRRSGGIFHGPQADALRLLLDLIPGTANPDTQAKILLLPFLRAGSNDWPKGRPATMPPQLERWVALARAGRWPEFFDAVLLDGGHLARVAAESESDAARLLALARALGEAGSAPGTSAAALADRFDALRRGEGEGDEGVVEDGHDGGEENRRDGSAEGSKPAAERQGAVTVMTLHMSKGLEFPIVFVAATSAGKRPDFYTLREYKVFRHVLDTPYDKSTGMY